MNVEHMKEFLALVNEKSYNEAAQKMYVSQSALFKHIRSMENELGVTLFKKNGRKIEATRYGEIFGSYAKKVVALMDSCAVEIEDERRTDSSLIRVSAEYRIHDLIDAFYTANTEYRILSNGFDGRRHLMDNKCDVAILLNGAWNEKEQPWLEGYDKQVLTMDYAAVVVNKDHPLADKSSIPIEKLFEERMVRLGDGTDQDLAAQIFALYGKTPRYYRNVDSGREAMDLIQRSPYMAIMHGNNQKKWNKGDHIKIIDIDPVFSLEIAAFWRKDIKLSAAAKRFIEFAKTFYEEERTGR